MRPVRQIVATARSIIRTGQLDARVPVRDATDEFDELVRLFNTLLDKNQALIEPCANRWIMPPMICGRR